jgi:hypothetical protein
MKRTAWVATALMTLLALTSVPLLWSPGSGAIGQGVVAKEARQPAKWEYGELLDHQGGVVSWASPSGKVAGVGWKDLLKKLVGREGEGEALAVLNALGEQGWELVAISERPLPVGERVKHWTFKRPK